MIAVFKRGDFVRVTYEGRTVEAAMVTLASNNGRSLVVMWGDGMLGGHAGVMPILQDDTGAFHSVMEGLPVTLTPIDKTVVSQFEILRSARMRPGQECIPNSRPRNNSSSWNPAASM